MATYSTTRSSRTPSSTSRTASRREDSSRLGGSSCLSSRPGDSDFSYHYPLSTSSQTRSDRTGSTWPASQTVSTIPEPPPTYESAVESETEDNDRTTSGATEQGDPHIVLAIDYGTTFSGEFPNHDERTTCSNLLSARSSVDAKRWRRTQSFRRSAAI